jgi:hypothetical protein
MDARWIRHRDLAARPAPEAVPSTLPSGERGRRESRVPMTPAVVCKIAHGGPQVRRNTRPSLRSGLRLMARSSRSRIPLASVADGLAIDRNPVEPGDLHRLDTSHGCRNHTLLPSAASSNHPLRPARMPPEEVLAEAFKRRSSARGSIAHGPCPPCHHMRARRCCVHRIPAHVRDARETPLVTGRNGRGCTGDLGRARSGLFLRRGLDAIC